jgi:threonine-phosphate decarboxylase
MAHGGDIYRNKVNKDFSVNLNPMGIQDEVLSAVHESVNKADCYTDLEQEEVREVLAKSVGVDKEFIYAGNGASELIMAVVRAVNPKNTLLFEPVFSGYEYALDSGITRYKLSETECFRLSSKNLELINDKIDLIFFCDPVNPTGQNIDDNVLSEAIDKAKNMGAYICVDESFIWMSEKAVTKRDVDLVELVKKYDNLIIIRSLTKLLAMPGIRMGYVITAPQNIEKIRKQLPEWNLSVMSEAAIKSGIKLINETDFIQRTNKLLRDERRYLSDSLQKIGLKVFESDTAFILFKGPVNLYDKLLDKNVMIRDCSDFYGLEKGFYRIAIKNHDENEAFIRVLKGVIDY